MRVWPAVAMEDLQDCFECTDWGMFKSAAVDIQDYSVCECVCAYVEKYMKDGHVAKIITQANEMMTSIQGFSFAPVVMIQIRPMLRA